MENLKVAIYYDWLNQWGGAERVLLDLLEIYPDADIYTLFYNPKKVSWLPKTNKVFSLNLKNNIFYTPFYAYNLEKIDFSSYDLVISTTSHVGHCLLTTPKTLYVCYYHNINRYLYLHPPFFLKPLLNQYQKIDKIFSKRPDYILCNSKNVASRIYSKFTRKAKVIYPGIDTNKFVPNNKKPKPYFLIVSRLVAHKKIDIAINALENSPFKLKIVGQGRDEKYLKLLAKNTKNIEFYNHIDDNQLVNLYQNCLGLIHPQEEDFGLTALEVQACGRGVIAFNQGGVLETVINNKTGIFFSEQNEKSLIDAIKKYIKLSPKSIDCRRQSLLFDRHHFVLNFKHLIDSIWLKRQQHILS